MNMDWLQIWAQMQVIGSIIGGVIFIAALIYMFASAGNDVKYK